MDLINLLWNTGYPADLIPTTEIENGSLKVDEDGWVHYGSQRYAAVVLYHPEFERESTSEFFSKAGNGKTAIFRIGNWTKDFSGKTVNADKLLPKTMVVSQDYRDIYCKRLKF